MFDECLKSRQMQQTWLVHELVQPHLWLCTPTVALLCIAFVAALRLVWHLQSSFFGIEGTLLGVPAFVVHILMQYWRVLSQSGRH